MNLSLIYYFWQFKLLIILEDLIFSLFYFLLILSVLTIFAFALGISISNLPTEKISEIIEKTVARSWSAQRRNYTLKFSLPQYLYLLSLDLDFNCRKSAKNSEKLWPGHDRPKDEILCWNSTFCDKEYFLEMHLNVICRYIICFRVIWTSFPRNIHHYMSSLS